MKMMLATIAALIAQGAGDAAFDPAALQAKAALDAQMNDLAAVGDLDGATQEALERAIDSAFEVWREDSEYWRACGPCTAPDADPTLLSAYIVDQTAQRAYFEVLRRSGDHPSLVDQYGELRRALITSNVEAAAQFLRELSATDAPNASEADWDVLSIIARHGHEHPSFLVAYLAELAVRADRDENRAYDVFYFMDFLAQFRLSGRGQSIGAYVVCRNGEAEFEPDLQDPPHSEDLRRRFGLPPISEYLSERSTRC